ncbi:MAG: hypothetical protein ACD_58C00039G0003 [uncultured bacterium]|nr:MAG: hypothetical protein ACD_58C00039G0003 [uncultured bacterium]
MNLLIKEFSKKYLKNNVADVKPGDIVKIHQKIREGAKERIQIFEGIVIKVHGSKDSLDGSFTVRHMSFGVGVERTFPFHLPTIVKIEKTKSVRVRRSKLYFLRELTDKQIRRRGELKGFAVWEEKAGIEEEEKIKAEKEAEAKAKEEAKLKEKEELEKKFTAARGEVIAEQVVEAKDVVVEELKKTETEEQKNE